jgi:hypothetical protein
MRWIFDRLWKALRWLLFWWWWKRILEWILDWLRNRGGGGTIPDDKCCVLARPDNECYWIGSKSNFSCPSGYYRQWWYCCEGSQQIACAECTTNPNTCWSGTFACSIWWYTGQTC